VHAYCPNYVGGGDRKITVWSWPQAKAWDPTWKITITKRTEGIVQVVEHLRPWVQTSVLSKKKKKYILNRHSKERTQMTKQAHEKMLNVTSHYGSVNPPQWDAASHGCDKNDR
jgi:hypothetical protein